MKVVNYAAGADTGGQSYRLKQAFTKLSDIDYRSLVRSTNYLQYPKDLPWQQAANALQKADVIHVNASFRTLERYWKPTIIHHHGTGFRQNPEGHLAKAREWGSTPVVSTLDLWLLAPDETTWLPAPYDLDWLDTYRKPTGGTKLRIGHAPTDRAIKSTDALIKAVARIPDAQLVLIEGKTWADCLKLKGTVDVFFDQVILGYGNNAIEAWGMGIPVVCGAQPDTLAEMTNRFGELPFVSATEDSIYEALMVLTDEVARKEWGERGRAHAERFHSERAVVDLMWPIYEEALIAPLPERPLRQRPRGPRRRGRVHR